MTRKILTVASALLCAALIIFIFSNSLDNAKESTKKSDAVYIAVNQAAKALGIKAEISKAFIRQSAHFLEFAALGFSAALTLIFALTPDPRHALSPRLAFAGAALPFCALVALTDEYIQTFSDGRVFDVADILTDTVGSCVGALFTVSLYLLLRLFYRAKEKHALSKEK
jgi:VanZ family protein